VFAIAVLNTSPFIVSFSYILAVMRTKQIKSRYKGTSEAGAACLRLVPETFQCVTTNCNSNGVSILKVDCPCRYTSVCYRYNAFYEAIKRPGDVKISQFIVSLRSDYFRESVPGQSLDRR